MAVPGAVDRHRGSSRHRHGIAALGLSDAEGVPRSHRNDRDSASRDGYVEGAVLFSDWFLIDRQALNDYRASNLVQW